MTDLKTLTDRILADPLAPARAAPNAVGYVGLDIPEDLLAATGAHAVHLPWDLSIPTPRASGWLESTFAPWTLSTLEQWAEGAFDFLPYVLFPRSNDSAQRLYYYITELRRRGEIKGPEPLILDIASIPRASSVARSATALRQLADRLGLSDTDLEAGIETANTRRRYFADLDAARSADGALYERIARAALFAPLEGSPLPDGAAPARRLLLAGTAPPDDALHRAADAAGWTVVGEAHDRTLTRLGAPIEGGSDPVDRIVAHQRTIRFTSRGFTDPVAAIVEEARRTKAEAVVLWLIEEEEAIVWHVAGQLAALGEAGIPTLALTRRRWDCNDGAAAEITDWLEGLAR